MLTILHPVANFQAFLELIGLLRRYRTLVWEMARSDVTSQYAGQVLGTLWVVGHPLFLMALFVFVFAVVFKLRIGGTYELPLDYTAYILAGLVPWLASQQALMRACTALTGNAALVKQVVFPIEVLPTTAVVASAPPLMVGLLVLVAYVVSQYGAVPYTYLVLPALLIFHALAILGIAMAFSAIGAFLRDLKDLVQLFAAAGIYMLPIVYLPHWVPGVFKPILYLNPFSYMIWCYQDVLYFGRFEHPWAWAVFITGSLVVFASGYRLFRKLKPQFGNVL